MKFSIEEIKVIKAALNMYRETLTEELKDIKSEEIKRKFINAQTEASDLLSKLNKA